MNSNNPRWRTRLARLAGRGRPASIRKETNLTAFARISRVVKLTAAFVVLMPLLLAGCNTQNSSPDEVRERTAQATSEIKKDAKAVADGVKEGWNRNQPLNINKATKDQLQSLPGMSAEGAERIIDGRPYSSATELVHRKIVSQQEYDKIKDQITAQ
jgi:Helix-hairpin-helix motif